MNKKLIAIIAVIAALVIALCIFSFSGKDDSQPETTVPADGQPITVNFDIKETEKETKKADYDTRITVTLPIEAVDAEYRDNLEAFAEAKGYFSIKKVGDTHVKIKMREYSYRLLLTSKGIETVGGIGYAIDSGDYPFVIKFEKYNSDFSEVIFSADKEKYEKAENKDEFFSIVALYCLYYQSFCTDSPDKCKITVCEKGTNILLETREMTEGDIK